MKFGFCAPWEQAAVVEEAGFDYIEPSVVGGLKPEQLWTDTAFASASPVSIKAEAFNVLLPGDLKVVGPDIDLDRMLRYLTSAFDRLEKVGAKRVVFGSAGARGVPEGYSREAAREQIIEFLTRCAPLAAAHGVVLTIEPLGSAECNIIVSVEEAMGYVKAVDHPSIQVLADLYHIDSDSQSHAETRDAGPALQHVHVAGRVGRRVPNEDDLNYLTGFFTTLKAAGYDDRISVEARVEDIVREAPISARILRLAWAAA